MKLTAHFTLEEFEHSATAEHQHIDNHVPQAPPGFTSPSGATARTAKWRGG